MRTQTTEKEKRKKRNRLIAIVLSVSIIAILFISFDPFSVLITIVDDNGVEYIPSTEYGVGIPVLEEIDPEVDYDGIINLEWSLETAYTITKFYIFDRYESGIWRLKATLENVYSYKPTCYTEGMFGFRIMGVATIDGEEHNSQYSSEQSVQVSFQEISIPVLKAIESPNTDGTIELDWNEVVNPYYGSVSGYRVFRQFALGGWTLIDEVSKGITDYTDDINVNGTYQYYIKSITYVLGTEILSEASNIQTVVVRYIYEDPPSLYPTNPSIIINDDGTPDGAETTDSFSVTLTLYCDNADEMKFKINEGGWTGLISYSKTYPLTLPENDPDRPYYTVWVIFSNEEGTSEDAGYAFVNDLIIYIESTLPPDPLPSSPSISINEGATTDSYEITLSLYCVNADGMQFKINDGQWTNWITYSTTHPITLPENDPNYPDYKVEVIFKNINGTTEDAGYTDVHDDITYDLEGEPPEDEEADYTLVYVLIVILGGLIGIVVFVKYKKPKKVKIDENKHSNK